MAFTTSLDDILKIYNWGDADVLKYTGLDKHPGGAIKQNYKQILAQGGNFVDPAFPHNDKSVGSIYEIFDDAQGRENLNTIIKMGFNPNKGYSWVRIKDFIKLGKDEEGYAKIMDTTPVFSVGESGSALSPCDISQGSVGNCWFLAAVGAISTCPAQFEWCVPRDNEYNETGVYHFVFWYQGLYVDVVVDDYIPVFDQYVGGSLHYHTAVGSAPALNGDKLEWWGPLAEKAYAKLWGSYLEIVGGQVSNGFENITGGFPEYYDLGRKTPADLLKTIKESLNSNTFLGLSCGTNNGGLVSGHAYSITAHTVVNFEGQPLDLIQIRNPWGSGEWYGPWGDSDPNWDTLTVAEQANRIEKDDGTFWMSYRDMIAYFRGIHVVTSYTREDFEKAAGKLRVERHFGKWSIADNTAGSVADLKANPHYEVTVGGSGNELPLAVALSRQRSLHSEVNSGFIVNKDRLGGPMLKDIYGRETTSQFSPGFQTSGFKVSPGKYVITPLTYNAGVERKFCLRLVYQTS